MYQTYYKSPIGILEIVASDKGIVSVNFVKKAKTNKHSVLTKKCSSQLKEYFARKRKRFDVPILISGTNWQVRVYTELSKVPFSHIISYQDLASMSGSPKAARAVGNAVNKNKLAIIIPCHRVLGSKGDLVGYEGGLWRKSHLLEHERC